MKIKIEFEYPDEDTIRLGLPKFISQFIIHNFTDSVGTIIIDNDKYIIDWNISTPEPKNCTIQDVFEAAKKL